MIGLILDDEQRQHLRDLAQVVFPHECCGLIAGKNERAVRIIPITNISPDSLYAYRMDNRMLLRALKQMDADDLELLAIYHSHPSGRAIPSTIDIQTIARTYPGISQVIIGVTPDKDMDIKAWSIACDRSVVGISICLPGQIPDTKLSSLEMNMLRLSAVVAVSLFFLVAVTLLPPAPPIP